MIKAFKVWVSRNDGSTLIRVVDLRNIQWLLDRLAYSFVFKTCEPVRDVSDPSSFTFRVNHNSQVTAAVIEKTLVGLPGIEAIVERRPRPTNAAV